MNDMNSGIMMITNKTPTKKKVAKHLPPLNFSSIKNSSPLASYLGDFEVYIRKIEAEIVSLIRAFFHLPFQGTFHFPLFTSTTKLIINSVKIVTIRGKFLDN
jgi:hypothetical protein